MHVFSIILLLAAASSVCANEPPPLKFAVVALINDPSFRRALEDELVDQLQEVKFEGARASHPHVKFAGSTVSKKHLVASLERLDVQGALVIRPLAVDPHADSNAIDKLPQSTATTITEFLNTSGGEPDWSTAVQIGAFLFTDHEPLLFWRGVSWIEESQEQTCIIERLAEVIASNAAQARADFRRAQVRNGHDRYPPLNSSLAESNKK